ncbi:MAG: DUF3788 family protein [Melioribacteraceae bacterium]|jgi:hypothetical protein|nr:DUF3788 family protein [Melioribacteraceae bacterium]
MKYKTLKIMETRLLRELDVQPTNVVIENALGESYLAFNELIEIISNNEFSLTYEWKYYNDGKSCLCKVLNKKKTVFWISIWDKFFKVGFYFTEKTRLGIVELDIENSIKEDFKNSKNIGKLIPLTINMKTKEQIEDLLKIIEYKKKLK